MFVLVTMGCGWWFMAGKPFALPKSINTTKLYQMNCWHKYQGWAVGGGSWQASPLLYQSLLTLQNSTK